MPFMDEPTEVAEQPADVEREAQAATGNRGRSFWREMPVLVVAAIAIALVIRTFVVQAFVIPSESMVPALEVGDRVLVERFPGGVPERGSVVVFRNPGYDGSDRGSVGAAIHWLFSGFGMGQDDDEYYVKRVVGLPGERVEVRPDGVYVDGVRLDEPYVDLGHGSGPLGDWDVPGGSIFVMGDNRGESEDSRVFGGIAVSAVVGRAFVRIWPPGRWGGL